MADQELCWVCGAPTGRAGGGDDSLYSPAGYGPYCEECWDYHVIAQKATAPPSQGIIPADADVRQGSSREEPTATTRDRELAGLYMARWDEAEWKTALEMLTELSAQARREGREEGLREARTVALSEAIYLRKHLDDQHQADGAERVEKRLTALLDQPAPSGAEE